MKKYRCSTQPTRPSTTTYDRKSQAQWLCATGVQHRKPRTAVPNARANPRRRRRMRLPGRRAPAAPPLALRGPSRACCPRDAGRTHCVNRERSQESGLRVRVAPACTSNPLSTNTRGPSLMRRTAPAPRQTSQRTIFVAFSSSCSLAEERGFREGGWFA